MSQQQGFVPTMVDDRTIRLKADYVKGQRTPELALTKRGNKPALVAYMNDDAKSKIDVRLPPPAFWALIETVKACLRASDMSQNVRLVVQKMGAKNADGSFSPPEDQAIVSVGRDNKTNRLFIGLTDAKNEAVRKQFFFKLPGFMRMCDGEGQKIDEVRESEVAAAAWVNMIPALMANVLTADYKDFRAMAGGGNRGSGGGNRGGYSGGNSGGGGGQSAPAASSGGGDSAPNQNFGDDDFNF